MRDRYEMNSELIDRYLAFFLVFAQQNKGKCPNCMANVESTDSICYDVDEDSDEIDIYCDICDHLLATISVNSLQSKRPITSDEVLDVHKFLNDEYFEKSLTFYLKNLGKRSVGSYGLA